MKTNEIPEEIYVTEGMLFMTNPEITLSGNGNKIKYSRTNALIKKATDWLEDHIYEYLKMNRTWNEPDYDPKLIGDFRNYMKGE